jgi:hypothetical protein
MSTDGPATLVTATALGQAPPSMPRARVLALILACAGSSVACGGTTATAATPECRDLGDGRELCGPDRVTLAVLPGGDLVVQGSIQRQRVNLLVDTGAERSIVAPELLGVPEQSGVLVGELCVGDLCLHHEEVWAQTSPFSAVGDGQINGLLGMNTLREFVVGIDHGDSVTLAFRGTPCGGDAHALTPLDRGLIGVDSRIASSDRGVVALDTGATHSVLSQTTADELALALENPQSAPICTIDGCQDGAATTATVPDYCVFGVCATNVTVKYPVWDAVGFGTLSRFRVDLDVPSLELVFCAD